MPEERFGVFVKGAEAEAVIVLVVRSETRAQDKLPRRDRGFVVRLVQNVDGVHDPSPSHPFRLTRARDGDLAHRGLRPRKNAPQERPSGTCSR